jgi:hypothetical protein
MGLGASTSHLAYSLLFVGLSPVSFLAPLCLDAALNALAATWDDDRAAGAVNAWGNSFPAEELPFGRMLMVDKVPFVLAAKRRGGFDHIEPLGQILDVEANKLIGAAVLSFGEMGPQSWQLTVEGEQRSERLSFDAPGWLVERNTPLPARAFGCSHLHYVGGYELDLMRPVAWSTRRRLAAPLTLRRLILPVRPLVHILAISLEVEPPT